MNKPIVVFCDFDGTITIKDSFEQFIKFYRSSYYYYLGVVFLSPILILFKLHLLSNHYAKQLVSSFFFRGETLYNFRKKCTEFSLIELDKIIIKKALIELEAYKKDGAKIVIVSASYRFYLEDWCTKNGYELIATELEVINDKITGNFYGKNCYGVEKVRRIESNYNLNEYEIIAYGDTTGDLPMLKLASKAFYKHFN